MHDYSELKKEKPKTQDERIKEQNKQIARVLWTICLSMLTAIFTTLAATGQLEMWLKTLR